VLLLDDVSSELDERRTKNLFEFVSGITCQVLVTSARPELLPIGGNVKVLKVVAGQISG
jgi:recombinational DNA repair ATPase RecF